MTTLLIDNQTIPLAINLPIPSMSQQQFYDFCQANPNLRIERTATGEVIIMSPAFANTGNRNVKISQQLANWSESKWHRRNLRLQHRLHPPQWCDAIARCILD
jgi:Uma2 family endonuclease